MLKIILVFAELERNMTAERVTAVMLSRANNGQWNGGRVPYGYAYDKQTKEFSLDPAESQVVRRMYELYEREQSLVAVCRYFNAKGIYSRSGNEWTPTTVNKILKNQFYVGKYRYNVTKQEWKKWSKRDESEWITIDNHHVPLIDDVLFDRIQFILQRNRRGIVDDRSSYIKKNIHIFAGLVKCGSCGSNMSATLDRVRADGWRPSVYGCSKRRNNNSECQNKYVSDVVLGPFIFNYVANIIRAKGNITSRTDLSGLQKKLLRGDAFCNVDSIGAEGLGQLYNLLVGGTSGLEYRPAGAFSKSSGSVNERDSLMERKRKHEAAMNRLKSLYLYGDGELSEKDYIIERQRIMDAISEIDKKLAGLQGSDETNTLENDEFIEKASYFIMVQKLLEDRYVDYEKYIRQIDQSIPRAFIKSIIESIQVTDGRVTAIKFKNGMTHTFLYKA